MEEVNELLNGYFSAILFAETDLDTEESLDQNYSISDFDKETVESSKKMLSTFYSKNKKAIEDSGLDLDTIGNDIWYTRAGHGAGFFDHNLDRNVEKELTNGAKALGEHPTVNTYDGKISVSAGRVFKYKDGGSMKNYSKSDLQSMSDWGLVQLYCDEMGGIDENDLMIEVRGNIEERQNLISQLLQKYSNGSTVEGGFDEKAYHLEERAKKQLGVGIGISDINKALKRYENENSQNTVYQSNKLRQLKSEMEALILHYEDETKYDKGSTIKNMQVLEISIEQGKNRSIPKVKRIGSSYPYKNYLGIYSVNTLDEANELVKDISDFIIYKIKYFDGEGVGLPKYAIYIAENKFAKGSTINVGSKIMLKHEKGYSEIEARAFWNNASHKERVEFLDDNGGYSEKYANYDWSSLSPAVKDEVIQVKGVKYAKGSTFKVGGISKTMGSFEQYKNKTYRELLSLGLDKEDAKFVISFKLNQKYISDMYVGEKNYKSTAKNLYEQSGFQIGNKPKYAKGSTIKKFKNGGGIDINELNMPVIRTQFEEEDFEFKDGGSINVDTFNKMLDELDDLTNSYLESDYSSKAAMLSAHKEIEKKYPNQYSDFEKWLDKGSEGFFGYKKGGGVGDIAKKGMRVFDPHDVVSDKGEWKEDLEMHLTDYRGDAYGDPENWREMKPNIKFHDYDSKKTSFLKRNPSNVIAEYAGEIVGKWDADLEEGYIYYDKMKDGGNVVFSPVAVEKANIEELFEMAEEIGLKNYHNLNKEFLRKKILQKFNVEFKTGGVGKQKVYVDLFEDYENIPKKVQEIVDEYGENFGGDGSEMDYQDTANMLKDVEAVGYTFSYGLDNEPFGLRPIGVRLNQLRDYEDLDDDDYAEGGKVDYFAKTKSSVDFLFNKGDNIKVLQIQSNGKLGKEKAIILEKYPAKQNDGTFYPFYYVQLEGLNNKSLYAQDELIERHGNKPKMKNGGGIDINDLNMPVIRTQFEDEEYEFKDGGGIENEDVLKVAKAIFDNNNKKGKIKTSFGDKTFVGLKAMIENTNYDSEEIASSIFSVNEKKGKISTSFGDKYYGGLLAMINHSRANKLKYYNLGQMAEGGGLGEDDSYWKNMPKKAAKDLAEYYGNKKLAFNKKELNFNKKDLADLKEVQMMINKYHPEFNHYLSLMHKNHKMAEGGGVSELEIGNEVELELNNGKIIKGKIEKINPLKIRTDATSTQVIPNSLVKNIKKYANGGTTKSFEYTIGGL